MLTQQGNPLEQLLHRPRRTPWQDFLDRPCIFLARWLYDYASSRRAPPAQPLPTGPPPPLSVVCISDTHNSQPSVPDGDILIHAGDLTQSGSQAELAAALSWIRSLPHEHKIVVAGNHDTLLDPARDGGSSSSSSSSAAAPQAEAAARHREELDWAGIMYLQDEARTITCSNGRSVRVYGSPLSPKHGNWAFQYPHATDVWAGRIPDHVDILITHCPPRGHRDLLRHGCVHLLRALWRVRPSLHVCGHIHEGYGSERVRFDGLQAAFERTVIQGGGVGNLVAVCLEFVRTTVAGPSTEDTCQVVNASAVGGLRDHEQRLPIVVSI
ncbi:hypothetical protein E4U41_002680 [Claviceps citrina]|nr:hypothetical protein E4U41_002680 [Claviceps citrina]